MNDQQGEQTYTVAIEIYQSRIYFLVYQETFGGVYDLIT